MNLRDTIAAVSTPPGRSGLAVIRISGPSARSIASSILRLPAPHEWSSWSACFAALTDEHGATVDQVVATYFAGPKSYTAEDVVEISCHGAPVIVRFCLERALMAGARLAEPGEFTLRAFLNGRIDLPQAEAVRDLIDATTLYQARVAALQMEGAVSRRLSPIKEQLVELIALLEAGIDFAEDDISVASDQELLRRLNPIRGAIAALASSFSFGQCVHSGLTLAIVGRPNVGKSSLFNRLLEQDRAIVTDIPGTTRDLISESASIEGIPVRLVDTAGIRTGETLVESLGIERTFQAMADADVTIVVVDLSVPLSDDDRAIIDRARTQGRSILVGNKSDLPRAAGPVEGLLEASAQTGEGIDSVRKAVLPVHEDAETVFVTSLRQERLLEESLQALDHAAVAIGERIPHEMLLLDLYAALAPLDAITGATTADDILNRIFSTFCIGK